MDSVKKWSHPLYVCCRTNGELSSEVTPGQVSSDSDAVGPPPAVSDEPRPCDNNVKHSAADVTTTTTHDELTTGDNVIDDDDDDDDDTAANEQPGRQQQMTEPETTAAPGNTLFRYAGVIWA